MDNMLYKGNREAKYVIVGDSPNGEDLEKKEPLAGLVGDVLRDILEQAGIHNEDCVYVNAIQKPKPEYRAFQLDEMTLDAEENLLPFINEYSREGVIGLGNNAMFVLGVLPKPQGVNSVRLQGNYSDLVPGVPIIATIHPYFILKTPDEGDDMLADFAYGRRVFEGRADEELPMVIVDLNTPDDVRALMVKAARIGNVAYDFETTGVNRDTDWPVTVAFSMDEEDNDGNAIAYFWGGYDGLVPRYDDETMAEFVQAFDELFQQATKSYNLMGYFVNYDDWIAERWVGHELPGSTYDGLLLKWIVNNRGKKHGLKDTVAKYFGYPDYEGPAYTYVREIAARRGRVLSHPDDFLCLKLLGREPEWTENTRGRSARWPKDIDKKWGAFALIPYAVLRKYNAYDAVFTIKACRLFREYIANHNMEATCDLRHRINRELLRCEQRGMKLDFAVNTAYSKELHDIIEKCKSRIHDEVYRLRPDLVDDFNPNSQQDLVKVLFNEPTPLPVVSRLFLYDHFDPQSVDNIADRVEKKFYNDLDKIAEAINNDSFDLVNARERLKVALNDACGGALSYFKDTDYLTTEKFWCKGLYAPVAFTDGGAPAVGEEVLKTLFQERETPLIQLILMLRKASKLLSTYVDGVRNKADADGIVHARFNTTGTETGRISSYDPNGQNFNKYIRGQLIPRPGYKFVEFDLSAAEIRVIAAYSQDEALMEAMNASDIHTEIASMIFNKPKELIDDNTERRYAKTIVFGIIYGMTPFKLSLALNITVQQAEDFMKAFLDRFPKLKAWLDRQVVIAATSPYKVETVWGTCRSTRNMLSIDYKMRQHTERQAMNMPVQGTAGELTLFILCNIMDRIRENGWDCWLVNTTHDSGTIEVPEELAWAIDTGELNKKKEPVITYHGPMVELVREEIARTVDLYPLNTVQFKGEVEVNDYWSAPPNLHKALNFKDDEGLMRWNLIKSDQLLDPEEAAELEILEKQNA